MEYVVWAVAVLLRVTVGLWGYSGAGVSPMFGDFEAQRHWLEITISIPIGDWYRNTVSNDLLYWGLDYPPLTAYISYACGRIAQKVVPELVELYDSRGHESNHGKLFMRSTVIVLDILLIIPVMTLISKCMLMEIRRCGWTVSIKDEYLVRLSSLAVPGLLLIDHGHFQYNGVCLALALLGAYLVAKDQDVLGSVFFCLSLNFKQMSLYYAPVFFCFLLRKCLTKSTIMAKALSFIKLGITVILTFGILWAPFCMFHSSEDTCASSLLQVLHRQFPFSRGIFEDKVANIWYTLSVVVDFRTFLMPQQLLFASLGLTLLLLTPTCAYLLTRPATPTALLFAMINSSLAFFLASFQVHEKSVLLMLAPAAPLLLLDPQFFCWVQILGSFTMFPLLIKDKLRIPYLSCCALYLAVESLLDGVGHPTHGHRNTAQALWEKVSHVERLRSWSSYVCVLQDFIFSVKSSLLALSYTGMFILHLLELTVPAPSPLPDLYAALFSIFGAANLCVVYVVGVSCLWRLPMPSTPVERGVEDGQKLKEKKA